jgi:uncharacterized membrane protein YbhN (UPF0104 family)
MGDRLPIGGVLTRPGRFRWIGALVVAVATVVVVWANRGDIPTAWHSVRHAHTGYLAFAVALAGAAILNQAAFHASAQRAGGLPSRSRELLVPAGAATFLNVVAKSGGMAGLAAFLTDARRRGRPRGATVAGYVLVNVIGHVAFALTLFVGLVLLAFDGRFTTIDAVATTVFAATTAVQLGGIVAAMRSRALLRRVYGAPHRFVATLKRWLRRRSNGGPTSSVSDLEAGTEHGPEAGTEHGPEAGAGAEHSRADELYDAVHLLMRNRRRALVTLGFGVLVEVIGIGQLWCVLRAIGTRPSMALPVVAYAVSVLFQIVGFLPGGLGTVEASLGALLVSFSLTGAQAAAAVVLYRVCELWIPLVLGSFAAQRLRAAGST